jgi:hypothetical protein
LWSETYIRNLNAFSVAPSIKQENGTAHLCVVLTEAYRGQLEKGKQIFYFMAKIISINRVFLA